MSLESYKLILENDKVWICVYVILLDICNDFFSNLTIFLEPITNVCSWVWSVEKTKYEKAPQHYKYYCIVASD